MATVPSADAHRTRHAMARARRPLRPATHRLEGDPAAEFSFAQIAKTGPRRKEMGASIVTTSRSTGQLRGALARIAQACRQIVAYYERFGPDEPWGFADPTGWKCSARYCDAWGRCPGGAGL